MAKVKLKKLIDKLTKLHEKHGDVDVVIDYDADNGWYDLEKVQVINYYDRTANDYTGQEEVLINLQSSNEV